MNYGSHFCSTFKLRCLNIYINNYTLTVTKDLALYTCVTKYNASYSSPQNGAEDCANNFHYAANLQKIPQKSQMKNGT